MSADGGYVAFESLASNLVAGDTNATWDIFVRGSGPDSTAYATGDLSELSHLFRLRRRGGRTPNPALGDLPGVAPEWAQAGLRAIAELDAEVDRVMAPFARDRDHLETITGVGVRAAECIIAEIGFELRQVSRNLLTELILRQTPFSGHDGRLPRPRPVVLVERMEDARNRVVGGSQRIPILP